MKFMKKAALAAAATSVLLSGVAQAGTLEDVRAKGFVQCGVSTGVPGFAFTDKDGNWQGFDPAVCQAVAAAVLGDATKAEERLGWKPRTSFDELVEMMVASDMELAKRERALVDAGLATVEWQAGTHRE